MKASVVAWLISIVFFIGIFAFPQIIDGMNGGFALSFLSIIISLTAFISGFFLENMQKQKSELDFGKEILAEWTYSAEEWQKYIVTDLEADRIRKMGLFYTISAWAILFAILFPVFDREAGWIVSCVMLGLVGLIGIVAFLSIKIVHWKNLNTMKYRAIIGKNALKIGEQFHYWKGFGLRLDSVGFDKSKQLLIFSYSSLSRAGRDYYSARIPVPSDKINEAEELIKVYDRP